MKTVERRVDAFFLMTFLRNGRGGKKPRQKCKSISFRRWDSMSDSGLQLTWSNNSDSIFVAESHFFWKELFEEDPGEPEIPKDKG